MNQFTRATPEGDTEYNDGDTWFSERHVCHHCQEEREARGLPYRWADEYYSFGVYAGRYCYRCWPKSGFRDAADPGAVFDPADAGERIDADY